MQNALAALPPAWEAARVPARAALNRSNLEDKARRLIGDAAAAGNVLIIAAVTFVIPIWAWAVDAAGALGGIAALVLTAALLFWAAGRRGSAEAR